MKNWRAQWSRLYAATLGPGVIGWQNSKSFQPKGSRTESLVNSDSSNSPQQLINVECVVKDVLVEGGKLIVLLEISLPAHNIRCEFANDIEILPVLQKGQRVRVNGVCTGVSMQVLLENCDELKPAV